MSEDVVIAADTKVVAKAGEIASLCFAENPTTGYLWALKTGLTGDVQLVGSEFIGGGPAIGAGGMRCFRFRSLQTASLNLVFELARPWLADAPIKRFNVDLTFE